jgi:hypothetical protein
MFTKLTKMKTKKLRINPEVCVLNMAGNVVWNSGFWTQRAAEIQRTTEEQPIHLESISNYF